MPFIYTDPNLKMPSTQELVDGDSWIVELPFAFVGRNGKRYIVPPSGLGSVDEMLAKPDWTTDYGSIPMIAQNIFRKDGAYAPGYVVHDFLYEFQPDGIQRAQADMLLCEMLEELGAWWLTRNTIYSAVRIGGGIPWSGHQKDNLAAQQAYYAAFLNQVPQRWPMLLK